MLSELTIKEFLEKIASDSPAPGGGSVAALCAAIAASLTSMVVNLTVGKKGYEAVEAEMRVVVEEATELKHKFVKAIDDDSEAYYRVLSAVNLPNKTEEDKLHRQNEIQSGLKQASLIPMAVADNAIRVMELAGKMIEKGNKNAITDGAVGVLTAKTAVLSALYNVKINLVSIKDDQFKDKISERIRNLETKAIRKEHEFLSAVNL